MMAARSGGGFWRGFLVGLAIAALIAFLLAWTFPPLHAPDVDETSLAAPNAPGSPKAAGSPTGAAPEAELPARNGLPSPSEPKPDRAP